MTGFTITDLTTLLRECAGVDEEVDLDGDIAEVSFEDLGYDSLALLNTTSRIERDLGVALGDTVLEECTTPQQLVDAVNEALRAGPVAQAS